MYFISIVGCCYQSPVAGKEGRGRETPKERGRAWRRKNQTDGIRGRFKIFFKTAGRFKD